MSMDIYRKLVDLYAARELPQDLEEEMEIAALADPELRYEMKSLRETVDILHSDPGLEITEEAHQRVLLKIYARGADIETSSPEPSHFQFPLPMQG